MNYKTDKYNYKSDHKLPYNDHRSTYYDHSKSIHPSDCENNSSRYILEHNSSHLNMTHHEGYHHNRYMTMNQNLGFDGNICCDENCEVFTRNGQSMQFERDCVECQRMLYEHRQHLQDGSGKKKKNQQQFEVCDCDPATVFQVPEQFQDDYIQEPLPQPKHISNKHNTNIFQYEHTTYLTTMTTTMTTDYRKDFHNSGASSLPPLNEGFIQNEKMTRNPDEGIIRETFISAPHRGEVKERTDGYSGKNYLQYL